MRLLYVDDDRINTLLFEAACQHADGVEIACAADGAEALAMAGRDRHDALVIDLHLPDMDGYALLARLRTLPGLGAAPAFLCSADDPVALHADAQAAGFQACWSKPIDPVWLTAELAALRRAG